MFSVLLSVYKKEQPTYLRQSLDSLFSQTLPPNEIVLVKDGPLTPELDAVITEYQTRCTILKVIPLTHNQGLGKALNEAGCLRSIPKWTCAARGLRSFTRIRAGWCR